MTVYLLFLHYILRSFWQMFSFHMITNVIQLNFQFRLPLLPVTTLNVKRTVKRTDDTHHWMDRNKVRRSCKVQLRKKYNLKKNMQCSVSKNKLINLTDKYSIFMIILKWTPLTLSMFRDSESENCSENQAGKLGNLK